MVNTAFRPDASLAEVLTARARAASDTRLALDFAGGFVFAASAYIWRPKGWFLVLSAAICFAAYGAWGIADRELRSTTRPPLVHPYVLHTIRVVGVIAGTAAMAALLCAVVAIPLGASWIS